MRKAGRRTFNLSCDPLFFVGVMENRIYLELQLQKSIQTDENGNWIIEAEASNESLDFQEQIVLQDALTKSEKYFLENGVISYDHRHLHEKENPEKYIIGEPLSVYTRGKSTFVKMKLYKSNELAQEIVKKLQDGSTRIKTSVGGKLPKVVKEYNSKLRKIVEKVKSVLWDELAITFKPVNQTLSPITLGSSAFVKALSAGYPTDMAGLSGGSAMMTQNLQGADDKSQNRTRIIHGLMMKMAFGDVTNYDEAMDFLEEHGYSEEGDAILQGIIERKQSVRKGVESMGDKELMKSLDDSIEELEKAMKKNSYPDEPKGTTGPNDVDPEEVDEEDEEEDEGTVKKSLMDQVSEDAEDLLDVSPYLNSITKGISNKMERMEELLTVANDMIEKSVKLQSILAKSMVASQNMLKSMGEIPAQRKSVLNKSARFDEGGNESQMERAEILQKANKAAREGKFDLVRVGVIEGRLNKGMPLDDRDMAIIKSM